jgi:hydroxypyruvate isomerase
MPRFCANLNFLFTEVPLLDRFEAAAEAGFKAVEIGNPYEASASDIAARLKTNGLALALINTTAGDAPRVSAGARRLRGREKDFDADIENALGLLRSDRLQADPRHGGARAPGRTPRDVVANLKRAAPKAAAASVTLVIEPMQPPRHPRLLPQTSSPRRGAVINEVARPTRPAVRHLSPGQVESGDVLWR